MPRQAIDMAEKGANASGEGGPSNLLRLAVNLYYSRMPQHAVVEESELLLRDQDSAAETLDSFRNLHLLKLVGIALGPSTFLGQYGGGNVRV